MAYARGRGRALIDRRLYARCWRPPDRLRIGRRRQPQGRLQRRLGAGRRHHRCHRAPALAPLRLRTRRQRTPPPRLGLDPDRPTHRGAPTAADPTQPRNRGTGLLPLRRPTPRPTAHLGAHRRDPLEHRRGIPDRQRPGRPGPLPGTHLDRLAPPHHPRDARPGLPRHHRPTGHPTTNRPDHARDPTPARGACRCLWQGGPTSAVGPASSASGMRRTRSGATSRSRAPGSGHVTADQDSNTQRDQWTGGRPGECQPYVVWMISRPDIP
jgi:hypothetical protein